MTINLNILIIHSGTLCSMVQHGRLSYYIYSSISELQDIPKDWLWTYNNEQPNIELDDTKTKIITT